MEEGWIEEEEAKRARRGGESILSKVPDEIWGEIGKRLESRIDVLRFRSVCSKWRSSLARPSLFPLRVPPPGGPTKEDPNRKYYIAELSYYAVNQMMVVFEEVLQGGTFSSSAIVPKSHREEAKLFRPRSIQLSSLSFLSSAYHIHGAYRRFEGSIGAAIRAAKVNWDFIGSRDVLKIVIISSDPDIRLNTNYARVSDLTVVAHLIDGRKLAVLRLASADPNWETGFCTSFFEDIINYRGQLYTVDRSGSAFVMDYTSLQMTKVAAALPDFNPCDLLQVSRRDSKKLHLAVSTDSGGVEQLHLLIHFPQTEITSKLYKLSSRAQSWIPVELPDHSFFMDVHCNFPVARDLFKRADGVMKYEVPRFCSWPEFVFIPLDENKKTLERPFRHCDLPWLAYLHR